MDPNKNVFVLSVLQEKSYGKCQYRVGQSCLRICHVASPCKELLQKSQYRAGGLSCFTKIPLNYQTAKFINAKCNYLTGCKMDPEACLIFVPGAPAV